MMYINKATRYSSRLSTRPALKIQGRPETKSSRRCLPDPQHPIVIPPHYLAISTNLKLERCLGWPTPNQYRNFNAHQYLMMNTR